MTAANATEAAPSSAPAFAAASTTLGLLLAGRHVSTRERRALAAQLHAGPWAWPRADDERATIATSLGLGSATPPSARPGQSLLLAADEDGAGASVLLLDVTAAAAMRPDDVAFGAAARAAWHDAHQALAQGLPVRWRSLDGLPSTPPPASRLARLRRSDRSHRDGADLVDGPSFGLGFALALASSALEIALHDDVCAMAAIDGQGRLLPVGGVAAKLAALATLPGARRVLVALEQAGPELAAVTPDGLTIEPVATVVAAVESALRLPATSAIAASLADPGRRAEWIDALFRLALDGHGRVSHWPPIVRAAAAARDAFGPALDTDGRFRLELAHAIAARHAKTSLPLPDLAGMAGWPLPRRLAVLAHAVQHAADTGAPDPATLAPLVLPLLPRDYDAFAEQCRLAGAWGRLLAARAEPTQALHWQQTALAQRLRLGEERGASQPLSECLRLGGLLGESDAVAMARAAMARCDAIGALSRRDLPYLRWAEAHAALGLGEADAADRFAAICADRRAPLHLRLSSARRLLALEPTHAVAGALLDGAGLASSDLGHRDLFAALVVLDRAVADHGDGPADSALGDAVATIERELAGPVRHLRAALGPETRDELRTLAAAIARHFPY